MTQPYFQDDAVTIYHGDCREIVPTLGRFDLLLTDPPYGIGYEASRYQNAVFSGVIHGDDQDFNPTFLLELAEDAIIWGGNNFANFLPRGGWLVWDKRCSERADKILGSPFELAWCSKVTRYKIARILHGGAVNADGTGRRQHPTQKPLSLMTWCISLAGDVQTILDPFAGSGTTGRAAKDLGRKAVLIEREERYCEIAARRMGQQCLAFGGDDAKRRVCGKESAHYDGPCLF